MAKTPARRHAPHIAVIDGQPTTTSRDIAETFGKSHRDVLERIRNLKCSEEFGLRNFTQTPYTDPQNGQTYTEYRITRDGFAFLCMGFTGARAAQWKERYINTFNRMAEKLSARPEPVPTPPPALVAQAPTGEDLARALRVAGEVAAQVQAEVFRQITEGGANHRLQRWLVSSTPTDLQGATFTTHLDRIAHDAMVLNLAELTDAISAPGGMLATTAELAALAAACSQRLATRLSTQTPEALALKQARVCTYKTGSN